MGPVAPLISVVICTHNRAGVLPLAIESVVDQRRPPPYELIVIDNHSTDGTRHAVRRYRGAGTIRYTFEPTLGLANARNTGWRMARGAYVAYLDDDAIAGEGWLNAIVAAFDYLPYAGVVGGRVDPIWEEPRPAWVSDRMARALSVLDWSPTPLVIEDPTRRWLVGANMAIPRLLLAKVGGFSPALGRRGASLVSNEEMHLERRLVRAGHPCLYYPAMRVRHLVPASRVRKQWFMRRYFWQGVSDVVMNELEQPSIGRRAALAMREMRRLLRRPSRLAAAFIPTDDPAGVSAQCSTWASLGRLAGLLGAGRPKIGREIGRRVA
jgi:glycosyltransferase involved in cell wall biosynthesis